VDDENALIDDALEMEKIVGTKGYAAILRLLKRKQDDLFAAWTSDEKLTKDYCKGQLDLIQSFKDDVEETVRQAKETLRLREEDSRFGRTPGGGELAV
jgi:hypothetical protein